MRLNVSDAKMGENGLAAHLHQKRKSERPQRKKSKEWNEMRWDARQSEWESPGHKISIIRSLCCFIAPQLSIKLNASINKHFVRYLLLLLFFGVFRRHRSMLLFLNFLFRFSLTHRTIPGRSRERESRKRFKCFVGVAVLYFLIFSLNARCCSGRRSMCI